MRKLQINKKAINLIMDGIEEWDEKMLMADGFDDAIIGIATRCSCPPLIAYSVPKILEVLVKRDKMTYEEAREFFDYNIVGSWAGEYTPIFIESPEV